VAKTPGRSRRLTAAARRAQLIDIGRTVFAKRGFEATSVEEIAARAKVSKPIVYEHFGGKEGLYAVIVDREVEHIVSRIVEAITAGTPRERLEQAVLAFLTYVKERPGGFAILLRDTPESKRGGEMPGLMYDLADRVGDIFAEQFRKAKDLHLFIADGELRRMHKKRNFNSSSGSSSGGRTSSPNFRASGGGSGAFSSEAAPMAFLNSWRSIRECSFHQP